MNQYRDERDKLKTKLAYQKSLTRDAVAEIKQVREYLSAAQAQVEEMEAELELCGDERDRWKILAGSQTLRDEIDRLQRELQEAQLRTLNAELGL